MEKIDGKIIWITGASSGIGEALVYALDRKNCKLIISSRKKQALERVKANCAHQENVAVIPLDLIKMAELPDKAEQAFKAFGTIDILINNAGISQRSTIAATDMNVYQQLIDINYLGTVALSKAVLPYFVENQSGHFVTVSSVMGKFAGPLRSGYCGAKHALHGFFDVLRLEHEQDGIGVTMICPGYVQTNIDKNALTADGSPQGTHDLENQNGLAVALFTKKMIRAVERKKYEAYMGGREVLGVYVKRWFPRLLHRLVLRSTT